MRFQYYAKDPMDTVPAPVGKLILSLLGCTAIFIALIFLCGAILGG